MLTLKLVRSVLVTLLMLTLVLIACAATEEPTPDSESHFLQRCNSTCADGLECLCGVCSEICAHDTTCASLGTGASCRALLAASGQACPSLPAPKICDSTCTSDTECRAISTLHRCENNVCRRTDPPTAGRTVLDIAIQNAPSDAKVLVLWNIEVDSSDQTYKSAEAPIVNGVARLTLDVLPDGARQGRSLVVGGFAVVPQAENVPNGVIAPNRFTQMLDTPFIYRNGATTEWGADFPNGYSCGACVKAPVGFDAIAPRRCSEPVPVVDESAISCNAG